MSRVDARTVEIGVAVTARVVKSSREIVVAMSQPIDDAGTGIRAATAWLSTRIVGSSVAQYIQKLPARQAELFLADIDRLKELSAEIERADEAVRRVETNGVLACIAAAIAALALSGIWLSDWLVLVASGLVVALCWWIKEKARARIWAEQNAAWMKRETIKERLDKQYGVVYREADQMLKARVAIEAQQARISEGLRINNAALKEIERGAALAAAAKIDRELVQYMRNQPPVLGGLPTEELLEKPAVERLFQEMSAAGLREHTVEAVLSRYGTHLPISSKTLEVAKARMQAAIPPRIDGGRPTG